MIKQAAIGCNSRMDCDPYNSDGFLPLITAPMACVVDDVNYDEFLNRKVRVCLPRSVKEMKHIPGVFNSLSLNDFCLYYQDMEISIPDGETHYICIDVANGNMPKLHSAIKSAKNLHGNSLQIMSGNVSSVEAFIELAKAGCDYIRVGIGGSAACNTSLNTGVGQYNLEQLIGECAMERVCIIQYSNDTDVVNNLTKVKIIADGISTFVRQLVEGESGHKNGYAAINRLLWAGADWVMIGGLFAQAIESAGEKFLDGNYIDNNSAMIHYRSEFANGLKVRYSGNSTKEIQKQWCKDNLRHSEGRVVYLPISWSLNEWLYGSDIESDDLPGFVNCLQSAMSYCGVTGINRFKDRIGF